MNALNVVLFALVFPLIALAGEAQHRSMAPDFSLQDAAGKTVELKSLRGKVVVVNFWATWCGPCRAEIPGMVKVYDKYKAQGLEIVGISLDEGGWDDVRPFLEKVRITYPIVLGNQAVAEAYGGISAIPTTFLVDRQGNVVSRHLGYFSPAEFEKQVKALL